jgi:hypothetical protein
MIKVLLVFAFLLLANPVRADFIFESAPPNGSGGLSGTSIEYDQIVGVQFVLDRQTRLTGLGGNLFGNKSIWAGLISLNEPFDVPACSSFEIRSCAIAETTIFISSDFGSRTTTSADLHGPIDVVVPAGVYAILLGTGNEFNLGTAGNAAMPMIHDSTNPYSYFFVNEYPTGSGEFTWRYHVPEDGPSFQNTRFFVLGEYLTVPEPASWIMISLSVVCTGYSLLSRVQR